MKIHLLVPMSGQGTRYQKAGYSEPKPLIPVNGVPMIERILKNFPKDWPSHFIMADNHSQTGLPKLLERLRPEGVQKFITRHELGPAIAILEGIKGIPDGDAVFVSYCDYGMVWDSYQFERFVESTQCDACVVSYRGFHAHYLNPVTYAYSRLDGERVVEVKEKGSFTSDRENEYASTGGYYFKTARQLREALQHQIEIDLRVNGEFYTSLTVEALIRKTPTSHVRVFEIAGFFQWGTPNDLKRFEYWEKSFAAFNRITGDTGSVDQVLMPMAGLGSRFKAHTHLPKPFIPIVDQPMYIKSLKSLPQASQRTVIVGLEEFESHLHPYPGLESVLLSKTPEGQAISTYEGVQKLDLNQEVFISSCDHGIALDKERWNEFRNSPDCDAAIFTITGFPGVDETPKSYAYVVPDSNGAAYPLVRSVSVKKPVSDTPLRDEVLVGTFWFRTAQLLKTGIEQLVRQNIRVNGELYLDSIFECLMNDGIRVRMIPLDGYIGWGDPNCMSEALYWQEIFGARRIARRPLLPGVTGENKGWH